MTRLRRAVPALVVASASATYAKPPGGACEDLFDDTDGGSFALSRDGGKLAKLTLAPSRYKTTACGRGPIRLVSGPRASSFCRRAAEPSPAS